MVSWRWVFGEGGAPAPAGPARPAFPSPQWAVGLGACKTQEAVAVCARVAVILLHKRA